MVEKVIDRRDREAIESARHVCKRMLMRQNLRAINPNGGTMENPEMHEKFKDDEFYQGLDPDCQALHREVSLEMAERAKLEQLEVTVTLWVCGAESREERTVAARKMLDRAYPVSIDGKVLFLERYEVRKNAHFL